MRVRSFSRMAFSPLLYRDKQLFERCFNRPKSHRAISTQYSQPAVKYLDD